MTLEQELQLIEEAKHNRGAFIELYNLYMDRVYKYCYMRLPNREIAEDVVSLVFMKLVENIQKIDTSKRLRLSAWIFRVAHNQIIDYYRKNKPTHIDWENENPANHPELIEKEKSEDFLIDHTRKTQIALTIVKINKRYQQIISLRFFAELETEEIALQMGISPQNVHLLLHRALKAFRKEFEKKYEKSEIFI